MQDSNNNWEQTSETLDVVVSAKKDETEEDISVVKESSSFPY
jgi:hypothetical protein